MRLATLYTLLLSVTVLTLAQDPRPSDALVKAIGKVVAKHGYLADEPGLAILIQAPGRASFAKGYGLANLDSNAPITPRTMFELASVSKTFTATATLLLQDRGQLAITDDVRKYLPELPEYRRNAPIHIRDLLCHSSGLPEYFDFPKVPQRHETYRDNADFLPMFARLQEDFPQKFKPGEKHDYCNSNYLLLAILVERVSGKSFSQFLHDELFVPAGMGNTFVYQRPGSVPTKHAPECIPATGYKWKQRKQAWVASWSTPPQRQEKELIVGDGSVWTNLEDMAKWDLAVRAQKFLKPETWKLAITPARGRNGAAFDYGLGWMTYFDEPSAVYGYGHDGSWSGFSTLYYRYLTNNHTIVILSNRDDTDVDALWEALDTVLSKRL